MPRLRHNVSPSLRLHRASGQAIVTLNGRDVYLGKHGSNESRAEYERRIAEWHASGKHILKAPADLTINELIDSFRSHAEAYYLRPDGTPTGESDNFRQALRLLRQLYGDSLAASFGPLALKAVRDRMIHPPNGRKGWARSTANKGTNRIRALFKWAAENEILPAGVWHGLRAVSALKRGRCDARETEPIGPVSDAHVEAALPHVSSVVSAMVQVQRLTGARPGEICAMRTVDIDRGGKVWIYRPLRHKTEHHGILREIRIGPKAQAILEPFLTLDLAGFVFSPADAEAERRHKLHAARKTPESCGNVPGSNRSKRPQRPPGKRYGEDSYRRAVERGCDLAFPPPAELARIRIDGGKGTRWESENEWRARLGPAKWKLLAAWRNERRWTPNQLRHSAATMIRREFGVELARIILGHANLKTTEIYAEADGAKAMAAMEKIG